MSTLESNLGNGANPLALGLIDGEAFMVADIAVLMFAEKGQLLVRPD